ncbi:hypothetical protein [Christiangramia forsetii]|uniref:Secreted protein n=2 Tax=Christiangramia forsetii TaxID=411153 RepID=A0M3T8_CHRFK|nr:hypothetical protein [Christiangramia forsetii]GGG25006.1 hypothetical protein GCM10011532_05420 [Christiangramia forsetii]CAL67283.1 secreted protein [Christiangramia forsetii KT0803]
MKRKDVCILGLGILFFSITVLSCSRDQLTYENNQPGLSDPKVPLHKKKNNSYVNEDITYSILNVVNDELYMDASCESTDFSQVLSGYLTEILNDPFFDFNLLDYYLELNRKYVTFYRGDNYYGENGEFNHLAKKRIRELTKFWSLDREIYLNGQHTAFLDDREILTDMIESFDRSVRNRMEAYEKADSLLAINAQSSVFPENPYFAFDAFTKPSGLLVIGDGILQSLTETGIDGDIAFSTMLAHEWWHQAQFEYDEEWDFIDQLANPSERTRFSELEADFAASYFLSHKRGATYNWKRIEEYFSLSFNVGDCFVQSNDHHGTPKQRLAAAKFGYKLAASAQKKGFILSPTEVHEAFLKVYELLIL